MRHHQVDARARPALSRATCRTDTSSASPSTDHPDDGIAPGAGGDQLAGPLNLSPAHREGHDDACGALELTPNFDPVSATSSGVNEVGALSTWITDWEVRFSFLNRGVMASGL